MRVCKTKALGLETGLDSQNTRDSERRGTGTVSKFVKVKARNRWDGEFSGWRE